MALIQEMVIRFKAESADYINKIEQAKNKNKELAKSLIDTAGSADRAIATLQTAKNKGALGEFGLDKRQIQGVISEIRSVEREAKAASISIAQAMETQTGAVEVNTLKQAKGLNSLAKSYKAFSGGNMIGAIMHAQRGMNSIEGGGELGTGVKAAATLFAINMVGKGLEHVTQKALELRKEFEQGKKSAGEIGEELLKSIPIFGHLVAAGRSIRELLDLDGTKEINRTIDIQKRSNDMVQTALDIHKEMTKEFERQRDVTEQIGNRIRANAMEMAGQTKGAAVQRINDELANKLKAAKEESNAKVNPKIDELQKKKDDISRGERQKLDTELGEARQAMIEAQAKLKRGIDRNNGIFIRPGEAPYTGSEIETLKDKAKKANDIYQEATARVNQVQRAITVIEKEQADLRAKAAEELRKRENKLTKEAEQERQKILISPSTPFQKLSMLFGIKPSVKSAAIQDAEKLGEDIGAAIGTPLGEYLNKVFGNLTKEQKVKDALDDFFGDIEKQVKEQADKAAEKARDMAEKFKESLQSPTEKLREQFGEAFNNPNIEFADLSKFLGQKQKSLLGEMKGLGQERSVYSLPNVSEMRSGQTLFVPPTKIDEKQLERLGEIRGLLGEIKDLSDETGIEIYQYGL